MANATKKIWRYSFLLILHDQAKQLLKELHFYKSKLKPSLKDLLTKLNDLVDKEIELKQFQTE